MESTELKLTNDGEYLLCVLYHAYQTRRKNGEPSFDAKLFFSSAEIQSKYIPEWPTGDIDEAARELARKNMLKALWANNTLNFCCLSDDGIIYMENRFSRKRDEIAKHIVFLRSLLFG